VMPAINVVARTMHLLLILLASTCCQPLTASAENAVSIAVSGGQRSAHLSTATFQTVRAEHGLEIQVGTAILIVDDSSGTNAGWSVTLDVVDTAGAPQVAIAAVSSPRHLAGQEITVDGGPAVPGIAPGGTLRSPHVVLLAEPGYGKGRYEQQITLVRALPAASSSQDVADSLAVTITASR
jgi:hypothetical protein